MKIYVVIEGGCVRYIASDHTEIEAIVIDRDDIFDLDPGRELDQKRAEEAVAASLPRIW